MPIALAAARFDAAHAVRMIGIFLDRAVPNGLIEARPAAAGIEFGIGHKERIAATGAAIQSEAMLMQMRPGAGALGAMLAQDSVLLWCEAGLPINI